MIGNTMLNEETMHAGVGDVKGHSQNNYTRRGNASMALDPPWGIKEVVEWKFLGELAVSCKRPRKNNGA